MQLLLLKSLPRSPLRKPPNTPLKKLRKASPRTLLALQFWVMQQPMLLLSVRRFRLPSSALFRVCKLFGRRQIRKFVCWRGT